MVGTFEYSLQMLVGWHSPMGEDTSVYICLFLYYSDIGRFYYNYLAKARIEGQNHKEYEWYFYCSVLIIFIGVSSR